MIKLYTKNNGKYLEERYNEIISKLNDSNCSIDYAYVCGCFEVMIETVINELKSQN